MALDEFTVVLRARAFVRKTNPVDIPVSLDAYLKAAKAVLRQETDMAPDEAGSCFRGGDGTHYISVKALLHDSTAARVGALFQLLVQDTTAQDFGLPSSAIRLRM